MAKVTGPLMSIDESFAFADTLGLCQEEMIEEIESKSVTQELVMLALNKFTDVFDHIQPYQQKGTLDPRPLQGHPCPGQHKNSPIRASTRNRATFFM